MVRPTKVTSELEHDVVAATHREDTALRIETAPSSQCGLVMDGSGVCVLSYARTMRLFRVDKRLNYGRQCMKDLLAEAAPFSQILDIGAGSGDDLLASRTVCPGASLFAVDFSDAAATALRARGVDAIAMNVEEDLMPYRAEAFGVVISNQTFEHAKDLHWILHQVATVLEVGGSFIVGVPNLASFHNRFLLLAGSQPTCIRSVGPHVRGFTTQDLRDLVEIPWAGGMRLASCRGANFYPFPPTLARPLAKIWPSAAWAVFLRFEKSRPYDGEYLSWLIDQQFETSFRSGPRNR